MKGAELLCGLNTIFSQFIVHYQGIIERLYCYDILNDDDRSAWLNFGEIFGIKYEVTVAICEQNYIDDMEFTSLAMDKPLQAVGHRVVESMKVIHLFNKGEAAKRKDILD